MHCLLIAAAFTITPTHNASYASAASATAYLKSHVKTGSLLVSKGDCLAVKIFSNSPYTHVAMVVKENGKYYVYESANGYGVICESLESYIKSEAPTKIYVLNPKSPFPKNRKKVLSKYLESQRGRPYSVKHHLTGKRCDGLHCSEYLTDALMKVDLIHAKRPSRVSPGSLSHGVVKAGVYEPSVAVTVKDPRLARKLGNNRCHQTWLDTKLCTLKFYLKLRRMITCR